MRQIVFLMYLLFVIFFPRRFMSNGNLFYLQIRSAADTVCFICRCIWQAQASDSFATIADRLPPANWLQVWFMNPAILHPDSALKVYLFPCFHRFHQTSHVNLQQNDRVSVGKEYIIEANDNLMSIAKRFGITADDLVRQYCC